MERVGEILKKFFEEKGLSFSGREVKIFTGWNSLVEPNIARHSRVIEVEENKLIVEVDHPGFSQLIYLKKNVILNKLNREYPDLVINDIKVILKKG